MAIRVGHDPSPAVLGQASHAVGRQAGFNRSMEQYVQHQQLRSQQDMVQQRQQQVDLNQQHFDMQQRHFDEQRQRQFQDDLHSGRPMYSPHDLAELRKIRESLKDPRWNEEQRAHIRRQYDEKLAGLQALPTLPGMEQPTAEQEVQQNYRVTPDGHQMWRQPDGKWIQLRPAETAQTRPSPRVMELAGELSKRRIDETVGKGENARQVSRPEFATFNDALAEAMRIYGETSSPVPQGQQQPGQQPPAQAPGQQPPPAQPAQQPAPATPAQQRQAQQRQQWVQRRGVGAWEELDLETRKELAEEFKKMPKKQQEALRQEVEAAQQQPQQPQQQAPEQALHGPRVPAKTPEEVAREQAETRVRQMEAERDFGQWQQTLAEIHETQREMRDGARRLQSVGNKLAHVKELLHTARRDPTGRSGSVRELQATIKELTEEKGKLSEAPGQEGRIKELQDRAAELFQSLPEEAQQAIEAAAKEDEERREAVRAKVRIRHVPGFASSQQFQEWVKDAPVILSPEEGDWLEVGQFFIDPDGEVIRKGR